MKGLKTIFCELNSKNWVRIVLTPVSQNVFELGKNKLPFVSLTHSGWRAAHSGLGVVGGRALVGMRRTHRKQIYGRENESKTLAFRILNRELRSYKAAELHVRLQF